FFFSSRRRHTRCLSDWSSDVCSSDLLFVALHGEHFDAHNFLEDVAKAGAAGAIVSQNPPPDLPENLAILRATDSLVAYQNLAARSEERRVGKECRSLWSWNYE